MTEALHTIAPEGNFAVEASAGTGKTWLLTSRIVRLLLDGVPPGSILAITFTRKAAAEIRDRIHQRLLRFALGDDKEIDLALRELGVDPVTAATRDMARGLYETVLTAEHAPRISTIHAFCQEVLQRFPLESGLAPGFQVTEAATEARNAAWGALLQEIAAQTPDEPLARSFDHLLRWLDSAASVRQALDAFLDHREDWWAFTEAAADPVAYATEALDREPAFDPFPEEAATLRANLSDYAALLGRHSSAGSQQSAQIANAALASSNGDRDALLARIQPLFRTAKGTRRILKASAALEKSLGAAGVQRILHLHEVLADALERWFEQTLRIRNREHNRAWFACGNVLLEHFQNAKRRHGQVDFADLEWKTYELLTHSQNAEWIQYKIDQRVDHLLIDEFQDTSPTQWKLLQPLLAELAAGDPERRRSVFLVGDTKQSIYRFRRAQPELFARARQWMQNHINSGESTQTRSRRSSPAIMDFVNLVFRAEGRDPSPPYLLPEFSNHDTHYRGLWGQVELLPLAKTPEPLGDQTQTQLRDPLHQPHDESRSGAGSEQEGRQIVEVIRSLLSRTIATSEGTRNIGYGDVLILVRNRTHVGRIEQQLRDAHIPYVGAARDTLAELPEIHDVVRLLRVLLSPMDNVNLASVLRSPVFACSDEHLIELARLPDPFWWQRLQRYAQDANDPLHVLVRAFHLLESWRQWVDRIPVHDLLDRIYADTNLVERFVQAAPARYAQRLQASLNQVLDAALEMDAGRYPSLSRFTQVLADSSSKPAITNTDATEDGRVRVMTIHSAKGLESPAVILADAARISREPPTTARAIVDWPADADRPQAFRIAGRQDELDRATRAMLDRLAAEHHREEANLLYVALTRPRQYLFITATAKNDRDLGWYGHMAECLQQELDTTTLAQETVVTGEVAAGSEAQTGNHHFVLRYGQAAAAPPSRPILHEAPTIDPALHSAPPEAPHQDFISPSAADHSDEIDASDSDEEAETARERGVLIHRALELLTQHERIEIAHSQWLHEFAASPTGLRTRCWDESLAVWQDPMLAHLFDPALYQWARNEVPLLFESPAGIVYGVADRVVADAEGLWLVDYKTHAGANARTVQRIATAYAEQLQLYAEGIARLWPAKPVRPVLLFTACRTLLPVPVHEAP